MILGRRVIKDPPRAYYCETCQRYMWKEELSRHHLLPTAMRKKLEPKAKETAVIRICRSCHKAIHDLYSNEVLGARFDTLEKILQCELLKQKFKLIRSLGK